MSSSDVLMSEAGQACIAEGLRLDRPVRRSKSEMGMNGVRSMTPQGLPRPQRDPMEPR